MKVLYYGRIPGVGYGNLIWHGRWPMRGGRFPAGHPVRPEALERLRNRGWPFVSCFPEGDGITFEPPEGRSHEGILADIRECLGFEVQVERV